VLTFRLIGDSQQGKADARASGLASAATSLYQSEAARARLDAEALARDVGRLRRGAPTARFTALARQAGLARAKLSAGARTLVDVGDRTAIALGAVVLSRPGTGPVMTVAASELTAPQYTRELAAPGVAIVVRQGSEVLSSTLPPPTRVSLSSTGNVTVDGTRYRAVRQVFPGFDRSRVTVTVLSALSATSATLGGSRAVALALIVAFLLLAFNFSVLASRALQSRLRDFLQAARRLGAAATSPRRSRSRPRRVRRAGGGVQQHVDRAFMPT
jgi:hypothetical protein